MDTRSVWREIQREAGWNPLSKREIALHVSASLIAAAIGFVVGVIFIYLIVGLLIQDWPFEFRNPGDDGHRKVVTPFLTILETPIRIVISVFAGIGAGKGFSLGWDRRLNQVAGIILLIITILSVTLALSTWVVLPWYTYPILIVTGFIAFASAQR